MEQKILQLMKMLSIPEDAAIALAVKLFPPTRAAHPPGERGLSNPDAPGPGDNWDNPAGAGPRGPVARDAYSMRMEQEGRVLPPEPDLTAQPGYDQAGTARPTAPAPVSPQAAKRTADATSATQRHKKLVEYLMRDYGQSYDDAHASANRILIGSGSTEKDYPGTADPATLGPAAPPLSWDAKQAKIAEQRHQYQAQAEEARYQARRGAE